MLSLAFKGSTTPIRQAVAGVHVAKIVLEGYALASFWVPYSGDVKV